MSGVGDYYYHKIIICIWLKTGYNDQRWGLLKTIINEKEVDLDGKGREEAIIKTEQSLKMDKF